MFGQSWPGDPPSPTPPMCDLKNKLWSPTSLGDENRGGGGGRTDSRRRLRDPPRPSKIHPRWASLKLSPAPPMDGARLAVGRFPAKLGPTTHEINCCGSRLTSYHRQPHNPTYFSMFLSLSDSLSIPLSVYLCASLSLSLSLYASLSLSVSLSLRFLSSVLVLCSLFSLSVFCSRSISAFLALFHLFSLYFLCYRSRFSVLALCPLVSISFCCSRSLFSVHTLCCQFS